MNRQQRDLGLKIACGVLIATFFMNWLTSGNNSTTAYDVVFGHHSGIDDMGLLSRLALILLPASGAAILFYELKKGGIFPFVKKLFFAVPLVAIALFFLTVNNKISEIKSMTYGEFNGSAVSMCAAGFWLSLLAAGFIGYLGFTSELPKENSEISQQSKP